MSSYVSQVRPLVLPSDLAGQPNGDLPDRLLQTVDGGIGRMHHLAARAFNAMQAHAKRDGITLPTVSMYRTIAVQRALFESRYSPNGQYGGCKTCAGYGRQCKSGPYATTACPGTSNHGLGLADDVASASGARLAWLEKHAWTYGFGWELVPEEPWHIRYCTGDKVPAAVIAYEQGADDLTDAEKAMMFSLLNEMKKDVDDIKRELWGAGATSAPARTVRAVLADIDDD